LDRLHRLTARRYLLCRGLVRLWIKSGYKRLFQRAFTQGDLCITLILAKIWEFTIDFIAENLMKFTNIELCRGLARYPSKL
jgi:hypothetical protein